MVVVMTRDSKMRSGMWAARWRPAHAHVRTMGGKCSDEGQEDCADRAAHRRLSAHRQQECPESHAAKHRRHEASQDRRIRASPIRPQGDRVPDEEQGEH